MSEKSKYRVKVVIDNHGLRPERKYVIQKRMFLGWLNECEPTGDVDWAYQTCEEMNTDYETIRTQRKKTV